MGVGQPSEGGTGFAESGGQPSAAITFDLWHTLVYLEGSSQEAYLERQVELAVAALRPGDAGDRTASEAVEDQMRSAFAQQRARANEEAAWGRRVPIEEQLTLAARSIGRTADVAGYLRALSDVVREAPFRLAPGALPVLRTLRGAGYRIGVISNTVGEKGADLRPVLHALGLGDAFDDLTFSDEHPWTKPDPAIFHSALDRLSSAPERAVHVGDAWADLEGARRAGLRAAVLYTGLHNYSPSYAKVTRPLGERGLRAEHRIESLEELPRVVRALLSL